jgi:hypothetical protein
VRGEAVEDTKERYAFTPEMGEISGMGGGYEAACRAMLKAGLEFWDQMEDRKYDGPPFDPQFHGFKGIYGVISEDNDDAKALTKTVIDASGGDATGAMHQAVISSIFWIRENGWDAYVAEMSKR